MQLLNLNKNIKLIFTWEGLLFLAANLIPIVSTNLILDYFWNYNLNFSPILSLLYTILILLILFFIRFALIPLTINFIRYNSKKEQILNLINKILSSMKLKLTIFGYLLIIDVPIWIFSYLKNPEQIYTISLLLSKFIITSYIAILFMRTRKKEISNIHKIIFNSFYILTIIFTLFITLYDMFFLK